ncbi:MAG: hypothetical protein JWM98_2769 [Thermoleophilia bacterium]|nr:hypothetical protein [Thermoleophilia bacterium]
MSISGVNDGRRTSELRITRSQGGETRVWAQTGEHGIFGGVHTANGSETVREGSTLAEAVDQFLVTAENYAPAEGVARLGNPIRTQQGARAALTIGHDAAAAGGQARTGTLLIGHGTDGAARAVETSLIDAGRDVLKRMHL